MPHLAGDQPHTRDLRLLGDGRDFIGVRAVDLERPAVFEPHLVHLPQQLADLGLGHEAGELAADLGRERDLAVRKRPRAAPAGQHAGLAVALVDVRAAVDDADARALTLHKLKGGEYARGTGSDDDDIVVHIEY